jgi:hypothetical protein
MTVTLSLENHQVISWNKFYSSPHWTMRKCTADEIHQLVKFEALGQEIPHFDKPVNITITAGKPSRLIDADNVCSKLYIDGLVHAGVILNDDPKYVSSVTTRCVKGNINYVEIEISDAS